MSSRTVFLTQSFNVKYANYISLFIITRLRKLDLPTLVMATVVEESQIDKKTLLYQVVSSDLEW